MRIFALILICMVVALTAGAQTPDPPHTGTLSLASTPAGANVIIDNKFAGITPLASFSLVEGTYVVVVKREGFCSHLETVEITRGEATVREVTLDPECVVSVRSEPEGAAVYVNEIFQGKTPLRVGELRPGRVSVKVSRRDYHLWLDSLDLSPAAPATVNAVLKVKPALVSVLASREDDEVTVNGMLAGRGSVEGLAVPPGDMTVSVYRLSSQEVAKGLVYLQPGSASVVKAEFGARSRAAFWYSMLFPGLGQMLTGAAFEGAAIATVFAGSLAYAGITQGVLNSKNEAVNEALVSYRATWNREDLGVKHQVIQRQYEEAQNACRTRNRSLGIAAGIYVLSLAEAFFFHNTANEIVTVETHDLTGSPAGSPVGATRVAMSIRIPL